ncbi:DEAD/DEAH box helicase [Pedobacter faecalis]|uniref:DEAD/DEAH box helicase n=1 Tax=Pedobacter faecalis TaxID=3041495 RepID=UPI00254A4A08|nr:DEAD/DEAH box helicase [Pedobacter sp. ELA7]
MNQEDSQKKYDFGLLKKAIATARSAAMPRSLQKEGHITVLIFSQHRFYRNLVIELAEAPVSQTGKLKNPLIILDPLDSVWKTQQPAELKFYSGVSRFRNNYAEGRAEADLEALKAVAANPLSLPVYLHDANKSSSITSSSIVAARLSILKPDLRITVNQKNEDFEISGRIKVGQTLYMLSDIQLKYSYFIQVDNHLYLVDNPYVLSIIDFFKNQGSSIIIGGDEYEVFQQSVLSPMEEKVRVDYSYLKRATKMQIEEQGFDLENEQIIYLSESEDFVLLTPVMKYGSLEIPVLSRKQIRSKDKFGKAFTLKRDEDRELQFLANIMHAHPYFQEQVNQFDDQNVFISDCFYMHRKHFLDADWFLEAFVAWRSRGIAILGFNELKGNKLSQYKPEIDIKVNSGMDWFETAVKVKFNKQTVALKHLHKSIRNKSHFVQLDDGTMGILPSEWIRRFEDYFGAGEVSEDVIRTARVNYLSVHELYEDHMLDEQARQDLSVLRTRLANFEAISPVPVPSGLQAKLRAYQQEGLNWLNFLDDFNFGACLADDMGLGKTIQVIAFILSQGEKISAQGLGHPNTNLIVVPASLIFNWQQELRKFGPALKVYTHYGAGRAKQTNHFDQCEVILTSYGTLLSDISYLKTYRFNYIFLDESQTIKNPDSQRYKAARLLQSRNKVVLTGTPVENNTFDLYGQLSFACPGLLGSKMHFKQLYSVPIDQFKDSRRAKELQHRIKPFILRRTKEQVARELPEKTEMIIYCEMGAQQREIYDAAREEIREYLMGRSEDELLKSSMHVLQGITRLRQICNSPALLAKDKYYGDASAKMDVLLEQIENKSPEHKILVFSQFVTMLDLIKVRLESRQVGYAYLTGQTRDREAAVSLFQDDPKVRVFLISLKAGGVGLNLTRADYVYLVDPWWNPAVENQAIDRAYRIGQDKHVMAIRLICPDTVEEKIMTMQQHKRNLADNLIRTEESIFKSLTKDDLLNLLS